MRVTLPIHELFLEKKDNNDKIEMNAEMNADLTSKQEKVFRYLKNNPTTSYRQMAKDLNISESTVLRYIRILRTNNFIVHEGPNKGGQWRILKDMR